MSAAMDVVVAALTVSFKTSVVSGATTDACNQVMRESLHRFVMKTLKRHWHAGCLRM